MSCALSAHWKVKELFKMTAQNIWRYPEKPKFLSSCSSSRLLLMFIFKPAVSCELPGRQVGIFKHQTSIRCEQPYTNTQETSCNV